MSNRSEYKRDTGGRNGTTMDLAPASFVVRTLIAIAERRKGIDAVRSRLSLLHVETAKLLHRCLESVLARHKLTDVQFALLVILFSTEPEPIAASVLAEHADASRSAVGEALDKLASLRFLSRSRDEFDRRVTYARITAAGQETVDAAVNDYLQAAAQAVRHVRPEAHGAMLAGYFDLLRAHQSEPETRR